MPVSFEVSSNPPTTRSQYYPKYYPTLQPTQRAMPVSFEVSSNPPKARDPSIIQSIIQLYNRPSAQCQYPSKSPPILQKHAIPVLSAVSTFLAPSERANRSTARSFAKPRSLGQTEAPRCSAPGGSESPKRPGSGSEGDRARCTGSR
ncbi:hypothetical protein KM043_010183 [Ampulex compressa]|nr:hypothetical protein KM043_010183 [Ampulex compressa]